MQNKGITLIELKARKLTEGNEEQEHYFDKHLFEFL